MKKTILILLLFTCFTFQVQAAIHHTDYGDGLVVNMNESLSLDIDGNGTIDFYINDYQDELNITAASNQGCIAGTGIFTDFGGYELDQLPFSAQVHFSSNPFYIEGDRGSIANLNGDIADGWEPHQDYYLGFMLWDNYQFGWMKIQFDNDLNQIIIKEIAYNDVYNEGIYTGQTVPDVLPTGLNDLSDEITTVLLTPNPTTDQLNIQFGYQSNAALTISIISSVGKEVSQKLYSDLPAQNTIIIQTDLLANGLYMLQLKTKDGIRTEQFVVSR